MQYKHSLTLRESLNVGILFYFHDDNYFEFVNGDGYRAKAIYPDFDNSLFNGYLKAIKLKTKKAIDLFNQNPLASDFSKFIHKNILAEDAAGLIFSEPVTVNNVFNDKNEAINEFSKLLLSGINIQKPTIIRHNENYILRKFSGYVFGKDKALETKFKKNEIIKTNHINLKFDLSWHNKIYNYLKPINFDLADDSSINNKAALYFGYISGLGEYANSKNDISFDFLITKPRESGLIRAYENALDFLNNTKAPKKLITEDNLESYSLNVKSELSIV